MSFKEPVNLGNKQGIRGMKMVQRQIQGFPGGAVVKNPPDNAG